MFFVGYSLENPQNNAGNIHDMQKARCLKFLNVSPTQKETFFLHFVKTQVKYAVLFHKNIKIVICDPEYE